MRRSSASARTVQIPPIITYHKILTQVKLDDDVILVVKHVSYTYMLILS